MLQFYEVDLPHASVTKQKLVDKVLPDTAKVLVLLSGNASLHDGICIRVHACSLLTIVFAVYGWLSTVLLQSLPINQ